MANWMDLFDADEDAEIAKDGDQMKMWIQLHDFSSEETSGVTAEQAVNALSEFDWKAELTKRDQSKAEICDPGLGLVAENGSILHICPQDSDTCFVHYHYTVPIKILGFIPSQRQESHFVESCSIKTAIKLIRSHFEGNRGEILNIE